VIEPRRWTRAVLAGLLGLALLVPGDRAEAQFELGAQAMYNNVLGGTWAIGGRVNYQVASAFMLQGTGDLYFPDCGEVGTCNLADFQLNGIFFVTRQQAYEPYLGVGWSFQPYELAGAINTGSQWANGPVTFIGSTLGFWGRTQPFLEAKWLWKGEDLSTQFALEFGFTIELGTHR
jgi:hypothetical protein